MHCFKINIFLDAIEFNLKIIFLFLIVREKIAADHNN